MPKVGEPEEGLIRPIDAPAMSAAWQEESVGSDERTLGCEEARRLVDF